jgi:hypothetical protein
MVVAAGSAGAQASDAQVVARLRNRPQVVVRQSDCGNKPVRVVMTGVAGAIAGWFFYTFGYALLASDHGHLYQEGRRQWMIGGALLGLGIGLYDVLTDNCPPPRRTGGARDLEAVGSRAGVVRDTP